MALPWQWWRSQRRFRSKCGPVPAPSAGFCKFGKIKCLQFRQLLDKQLSYLTILQKACNSPERILVCRGTAFFHFHNFVFPSCVADQDLPSNPGFPFRAFGQLAGLLRHGVFCPSEAIQPCERCAKHPHLRRTLACCFCHSHAEGRKFIFPRALPRVVRVDISAAELGEGPVRFLRWQAYRGRVRRQAARLGEK